MKHRPKPSSSAAFAAALIAGAALAWPPGAASTPPEESPIRPACKASGRAPPLEMWMPDDVIGFLKVREPAKTVRALLNSELREAIEATDVYQFVKEQRGARRAHRRLRMLEKATGHDLLELIELVMGDEAIFAVRRAFPPSVLAMTRAQDGETISKGVDSLKDLVRHHHGSFPETLKSEHRGLTVETADGHVAFAVRGDTLFASNSVKAVRDMIDLASGQSTKSLASSGAYRGCFEGKSHVTAAVRPGLIPGFDLPSKIDNPLASLLFSGWLETLRASDVVVAKLTGDEGGVRLAVEIRAKPGELAASIPSIFFKPDGSEIATDLQRIAKGGSVGIIHVNRDFAQWWQKRESFLDEQTAGEFLNANTFLSIFFGGISFQDEVLPAIDNGLTVVSRRLGYNGLENVPRPQIPGFAAVFRMKDPEKITERVTSAFYQVVSVINLNRGQKNKDSAFTLKSEKVSGVDVAVAEINAPADGNPGIEHNFAPSVAVIGKRVVLSSNTELTRELVAELAHCDDSKSSRSQKRGGVDFVTLSASEIKKLVNANREFLANTMVINEGISSEEAQGRLHAISEILSLFAGLDLETRFCDGTATLDFGLSFAWAHGRTRPGNREEERHHER